MLKLALLGCLTLMAATSVRAASCIITGNIGRSCSASGSASSGADIRAGGTFDCQCAATEDSPFEGRGWSFCLSNIVTIFDCLARPGLTVIIK
ncbi:MAG: hypothetical protein PUJ80_10150 [Verrucomicrobiota bacterium]|nr:hypothetical protein [Verrucomicrobiota bacterium]